MSTATTFACEVHNENRSSLRSFPLLPNAFSGNMAEEGPWVISNQMLFRKDLAGKSALAQELAAKVEKHLVVKQAEIAKIAATGLAGFKCATAEAFITGWSKEDGLAKLATLALKSGREFKKVAASRLRLMLELFEGVYDTIIVTQNAAHGVFFFKGDILIGIVSPMLKRNGVWNDLP